MNSRERILNTVALNKPVFETRPPVADGEFIRYGDAFQQFINVSTSAGAKVVYINSWQTLVKEIEENQLAGNFIINRIVESDYKDIRDVKADALENLHTCYLRSYLGVAENGSVWIDESLAGNRLVPFIAEHLVVVLNLEDIVSNMHDAYRRLNLEHTGFGVFIAGPSKTADIEQNLVIGAHGPKSLTIYLIEKNV